MTFGDMSAWMRWFSLQTGERSLRPEFSSQALPLAYYCIVEGLVSGYDEIFQDASMRLASRIREAREAARAAELEDISGACDAATPVPTPSAYLGEALSAMRKRCRNTMAVVMELACDTQFRDRAVQWSVLSNPFALQHGKDMRDLKKPGKPKEFYARLASFGWLETVFEMMDVFVDPNKLAECGLTVDFGDDEIRSITNTSDGRVVNEDADAQWMMDFALALFRRFAVVMVPYSTQYPCKLAAYSSANAEMQTHLMTSYKNELAAKEKAASSTIRKLKNMTSDSDFNTPFMKVVDAIVKSSPDYCPHALGPYLDDVFDGFGSEAICEHAIRYCRERETKDQNNKEMKRAKRWSIPRLVGLAGQWGHSEIETVTSMPVPRDIPKDLFEVTNVSVKSEGLNLEEVTGRATWPTHSQANAIMLGAKQSLYQSMAKIAAPEASFASAWMIGLLPMLQVCYYPLRKELWLTLQRAGQEGMLAYRLEEATDVKGGIWFEAKHKKTRYIHVSNLDSWQVVPANVISPLHFRVLTKSDKGAAHVRWMRAGKNMKLLEWQSAHGFAGVSEATLRDFAKHLGIHATATEFVDASTDVEAALKAAVMVKIDPTLTDADVLERLCASSEIVASEDASQSAELMDKDVLSACMLKEDLQNAKESINQLEKKRAASKKTKSKFPLLVEKLFTNHYVKIVGKKPQLAKKAKASPYKTHWPTKMKAGDTSLFEAAKPEGFTITTDEFNGCHRILYRGKRRKSISWATRGQAVAIQETLIQCWDIYFEFTGKTCPFQPLLDMAV